MRAPVVSLVLLVVAGPAAAHPLPARPDFDGWLLGGATVAAVSATGDPEPCGAAARPAVVSLRILAAVDGAPLEGTVPVLLGEEAPAPPPGRSILAVLRESSGTDGRGCAHIPSVALDALPDPPLEWSEDPAAWTRYTRGLRALGSQDRSGRLALWAEALSFARPGGRLARHAEAQLAAAGTLPAAVVERLGAIFTDAELADPERLAALRLVAARLPPSLVAAQVDDAHLPVAEAALETLVARRREGPVDGAALTAVARAWVRRPEGGRPADEIRRTGLAAALAALGDPRGRETLTAGLESRLFKVRAFAMNGLAHLARAGDEAALGALRARVRREPDARLSRRLEALVAATALPVPPGTPTSARLGLRMVLVLLGLLCLAGMVLLPRLVERRRK